MLACNGSVQLQNAIVLHPLSQSDLMYIMCQVWWVSSRNSNVLQSCTLISKSSYVYIYSSFCIYINRYHLFFPSYSSDSLTTDSAYKSPPGPVSTVRRSYWCSTPPRTKLPFRRLQLTNSLLPSPMHWPTLLSSVRKSSPKTVLGPVLGHEPRPLKSETTACLLDRSFVKTGPGLTSFVFCMDHSKTGQNWSRPVFLLFLDLNILVSW